jgi:SAM-dependent methyltransferase
MGYSSSKSGELEQDYRTYVGPADSYDRMAAMQFNLLTYLGLRQDHSLLDIGCGSLRAGRLFIPYLNPGRYFGIEPEEWLLREAIKKEVGQAMIDLKRPTFSSNAEFQLTTFGQSFDFIIAQSIFSHIGERHIGQAAAEAKRVLKPEGLFVASFFEDPTRNYTGDKWATKATYTMARMKEMIEKASLHCERFVWPHTGFQTWILITQPEYKLDLPRRSTTWRILQLQQEAGDLRRQREWLCNNRWTRLGVKLRVPRIAPRLGN